MKSDVYGQNAQYQGCWATDRGLLATEGCLEADAVGVKYPLAGLDESFLFLEHKMQHTPARTHNRTRTTAQTMTRTNHQDSRVGPAATMDDAKKSANQVICVTSDRTIARPATVGPLCPHSELGSDGVFVLDGFGMDDARSVDT